MIRSFQYHENLFHTDNRPLFLQFNPQVMTLDFTDKDYWKSSQAQIFQYFQITPLIIIEYVALWYLNIEYFSRDQLIGPYSAFIKTLLYLIIILLHLILIFSLIICIFKGFVFQYLCSYDVINTLWIHYDVIHAWNWKNRNKRNSHRRKFIFIFW